MFAPRSADLWSAPLQVLIGTLMLYQFLGYAGLCGLGVMIIAMPVQGLLGARLMKFGEAILGKRDARVKFTNEITNGIKLLKLFAWSSHDAL